MMWVEVNPHGNNTNMPVGIEGKPPTRGGHPDRSLRKSSSESSIVTNFGEIPGHNWVTKFTSSKRV